MSGANEPNYDYYQRAFINAENESMTLMGIPGGGKTSCIIQRILHLAKKGLIKKQGHFLVITFSNQARDDFLAKGMRVGSGTAKKTRLFGPKNIRTLHSLAGTLMNRLSRGEKWGLETIMVRLKKILYRIEPGDNAFEAIKSAEALKDCHIIFIDEAQDITENEYDIARKLAEMIGAKLVLIGDPNQNIYQFRSGSSRFIIEHSNNIYNLYYNYRSTPGIVSFINHFRPYPDNTPRMLPGAYGGNEQNGSSIIKPKVIIGTMSQTMQHIIYQIQKLRSEGEKYEDMLILGPVKRSKPISGNKFMSFGLSYVLNELTRAGLRHNIMYDLSGREEAGYKRNRETKPGHVNVMTIHCSKGLEFKHVFVINFHHRTMSSRPDDEQLQNFKYLWFVALSRAKVGLYVYVWADRFAWPGLKNCEANYDLIRLKPGAEIKFDEKNNMPIKPEIFSVTEILQNRQMMSEENLMELEDLFHKETSYANLDSKGYTSDENLPDWGTISTLYGIFAENLFRYYYHLIKGSLASFWASWRDHYKSAIILSENNSAEKKMITGYKMLCRVFPLALACNAIIIKEMSQFIDRIKEEHKCASNGKMWCEDCNKIAAMDTFYRNIEQKKDSIDANGQIPIYINSPVVDVNIERLLSLIDAAQNGGAEKTIFQLCLFEFQYKNECGYLLDRCFDEHILAMKPYFINIKRKAKKATMYEYGLNFNILLFPANSCLLGRADAIRAMSDPRNDAPGKVIEMKFCREISPTHVLQAILYDILNKLRHGKHNEKAKAKVEIWNFRENKAAKVLAKSSLTNGEIYEKIAAWLL